MLLYRVGVAGNPTYTKNTPCDSVHFGMQHIGLGTRPRIIEINRRKAILTGLAKTILSPSFRTDDKIESPSNFNLQVSFV